MGWTSLVASGRRRRRLLLVAQSALCCSDSHERVPCAVSRSLCRQPDSEFAAATAAAANVAQLALLALAAAAPPARANIELSRFRPPLALSSAPALVPAGV